MTVRRLTSQESATLRDRPLADEPGGESATAAGPAGYTRLALSTILVRRDFQGAVSDLLTWRVHERAGLRVDASDIPLQIGTVTLMRWGVGPLSLTIPCRVVDVSDDARRGGFTYGTLRGHPVSGEEEFLLEHRDDGAIEFTITALSRPASTLARLGGPLGRAAQRLMARRYLGALDRLDQQTGGGHETPHRSPGPEGG